MELIKFFKEDIESIDIIGKSYFNFCKNINELVVDDKRIIINKSSIILKGKPQIKKDINNEQVIYTYIYEDLTIKFILKRIIKLIDLLKFRKTDIKKLEIIGENFYFPCIDSSKITLKEESNPIMLSIDKFIMTFEKENFFKGILEQEDNIYKYDCKYFQLKITTTKIDKQK